MITTLTNLTMNQAIELIKGTKNTVYRTKWLELLGKDVDPALVSVGEFEGGEIRFVANDESYRPTIEDVTANDWCILTEVEAEEENHDGDNDFFDETIENMVYLLADLQEAQVTLPRFMFFQALAEAFSHYYGEETFAKFVETGELVHDEDCECPHCLEGNILGILKEMVESNDTDNVQETLDEVQNAIIDALSKLSK